MSADLKIKWQKNIIFISIYYWYYN